EATCLLQRWIRGELGRARVKKIVSCRYKSILDPTTGNTYYYNTRTKEVTWIKPRWFLEPHELHHRKKIKFNENTAASTLQRIYRGRLARRYLRQLLQNRFQKVWDPERQKFYFIDAETKETKWDAPKFAQSLDSIVQMKHKKRRKKKVLTEEDSAVLVQKTFRMQQARKTATIQANRSIEQIWDPASQAYFYHNKQTNAVTWTKPRYWVDKVPEEDNTVKKEDVKQIIERRRKYVITDPNEAAILLQTHYRRRRVRNQWKVNLMDRFQKVFDPNTKKYTFYQHITLIDTRYFYYDKEKNESQWSAPRILEEFIVPSPNQRSNATEESAAVRIQGIFRLRKARREALELAQANYEKVYDEDIQAFYYFNTKTGQSQWTKPKCFHDADADKLIKVNGHNAITERKLWCLILLSVVIGVVSLNEKHSTLCSRELSREAMYILEQHVYRPAQYFDFKMPSAELCPIAADQILFLDHESHKYRVHSNRWKCGYCSKNFRTESYLDKHMDLKHSNEDERGICLGDICDILNCPTTRALHRHAKCSHNTVFRLKQQCLSLFQSCFPHEEPSINTIRRSEPISNILYESVVENICEAITCEGIYEEETNQVAEAFLGVIKFLLIVCLLVGIITNLCTKTERFKATIELKYHIYSTVPISV
ncbi:hypothetical protein THRCLA_08909, partial [Thraustotheca clavata]